MSPQRLRKSKYLHCCIITVCLLIWLLVIPTSASAQPSPSPASVDTLEQMQKTLQQQRSQIEKERDHLSDIEQAAQNQLKGIQQNIQATDTAYQDYAAQLELANQRLRELQAELTITEQEYSQKKAATVARLRFLQRQRRTGFGWDVLLKSQSLHEFFDRRHQIRLLYQADRQILLKLKTEADRIKPQKLEVEAQKNQISLITQQLLAQKAQYQAQLTVQQQLIERLKTDKQALEAAQTQLDTDSRNIGILIRREMAAANKSRFPHSEGFSIGSMMFPSDAAITSGFGWRRHPILGYSRFHAGIDFGASYGSTIRAAEAGKVILAGWYGGYGNTVIISHGGGMSTLYGHASQLYVSEGQTVQAGDAIAAVGSTGLSTGPHLHFEVRQDGEPVNPIAYL